MVQALQLQGDMKTIAIALLSSLGMLSAAHAETKRPMLVKSAALASQSSPSLEPAEVAGSMQDLNARIGHCYMDNTASISNAGKLEITLSIHRTGALDSIDISTPGLPVKLASKIDACVRALVIAMKFPARRISTTAIVPYFYQRVQTPGSGPQYSCWNPKGCKSS